MWVYDLQTLQFLEVNEAAISHYGYSGDEFRQMRIADIRPPEDVSLLLEHLHQERPALQRTGQWRHRLHDGRIIDVEIASLIPWNLSGGKLLWLWLWTLDRAQTG